MLFDSSTPSISITAVGPLSRGIQYRLARQGNVDKQKINIRIQLYVQWIRRERGKRVGQRRAENKPCTHGITQGITFVVDSIHVFYSFIRGTWMYTGDMLYKREQSDSKIAVQS